MNSSFSLSLAALCCVVVVLGGLPFSSNAQLDNSFYKDTCPNVHSIVREVLRNVSKTDPRILASLMRVHFHDCFVQGCDASILLNTTSTITSEQTAFGNNNSIRGLDVVNQIKTAVENACPDTVSCADILALAAEISSVLDNPSGIGSSKAFAHPAAVPTEQQPLTVPQPVAHQLTKPQQTPPVTVQHDTSFTAEKDHESEHVTLIENITDDQHDNVYVEEENADAQLNVDTEVNFQVDDNLEQINDTPIQVAAVEDTLALTETHNGNQQSNSFADMRITGPWCDAVTDMDYGNDHNLDNFEQELGTNNSVFRTDLNLSNYSANVIHDMQVLGLVPTMEQQTMDFLSDSWSNMGHKENQPFQLVVPKKKKGKKRQSEASKGFKAHGPDWKVPLGRRDSLTANLTLANENLPSPAFNLSELKSNFDKQGLDTTDLVALSGAHTIGRGQCRFFVDRLYNFSNTGNPDPTLNTTYLQTLRTICPNGGPGSTLTDLDPATPDTFDSAYYSNLRIQKGLFESDQVLSSTSGADTIAIVNSFNNNQTLFFEAFKASMIKMSKIKVLTGSQGEIRKQCNFVNGNSGLATKVTRESSEDGIVSSY